MIIALPLTSEHLRAAYRVPIPTEDVFEQVIRHALLTQELRLDPAHPPAPAPEFVCMLTVGAAPEHATLTLQGGEFYVRVDAVAQALGVMPADLIRAWLDQVFVALPVPHPPPRTCVDPDDFADEFGLSDDPF